MRPWEDSYESNRDANARGWLSGYEAGNIECLQGIQKYITEHHLIREEIIKYIAKTLKEWENPEE